MQYVPRLTDGVIQARIAAHPAVLVNGPRACGKTTTGRQHASAFVRLDDPAQAAAFRASPAAALTALRARPLMLDEWQAVPEIMPALKAIVDDDPSPGAFILTGSLRPDADVAWPATGRIVEVRMDPLTVREQRGAADGPGMLAAFLAGDDVGLDPASAPDLGAYVDLALAGGFPHPALVLDPASRRAWYDAYVEQVVERDIAALLRRSDPARLRRYLEVVALHSGRVVDDATLIRGAAINRKTAAGYDAALERLFVATQLPAWSSNRVNRLVRMPKRMIVDAALMASAARIGRDDVLRDGTLLGGLLETFACAQLRPELHAAHPTARLHHLRTDSGGRREIDFIVDLGGGRVAAFEVKISSSPTVDDARHLAWLRDLLGEDFVRGAVLHTGPHAYPLGERLIALPLAAVWLA